MAWQYIVLFVIAIVAAFALAPKPQSQPPPGLQDIKAPTARAGGEIPVLFGTRILEGPNVVDYGDFKSEPVKKKP